MSAHTPRSLKPIRPLHEDDGRLVDSLFQQAIDRVVGECRAAWRNERHNVAPVEYALEKARLIAAAPALLEALEAAEERINELERMAGYNNGATLLEVRAAIAQAKGDKS